MSRRTKQNGKLRKAKTLDLIFALYQKKEQNSPSRKCVKAINSNIFSEITYTSLLYHANKINIDCVCVRIILLMFVYSKNGKS